jgi:hypothetical protein
VDLKQPAGDGRLPDADRPFYNAQSVTESDDILDPIEDGGVLLG